MERHSTIPLYTYKQTDILICAHTHTHAHTHRKSMRGVHTHIRSYLSLCTCKHTRVANTCTHTHKYTHTHTHTTHTHTHTHTHRERMYTHTHTHVHISSVHRVWGMPRPFVMTTAAGLASTSRFSLNLGAASLVLPWQPTCWRSHGWCLMPTTRGTTTSSTSSAVPLRRERARQGG